MKIRLVVPAVNAQPDERPVVCRYCGHWRMHRHGRVQKPVKDHQIQQVTAERYKCAGCRRTFRHYPSGITAQDQSQRTVVLAAVLYGLGLSCSAGAAFVSALGAKIRRMSVWRDAQAAGEVLGRRRPAGSVRVLGADETVYRVRGQDVVVGFVVDGQDVYSGVATELGLEHQVCLVQVRKAVARQIRSLQTQAADEWDEEIRFEQLIHELDLIWTVLSELPEDGIDKLWPLHQRSLGVDPPRKGERASVGYRLRLLTLDLIEQWPKLRLARARPELDLDGTNNATERAIGTSKMRYRTMRGYTSLGGMRNGIALTQWLYSGDADHDLAQVLAA